MTTISVTGISITYAEDSDIGVPSDPILLEIVAPNKNSTFSYKVIGFDEGVPDVDFDDDAYQIRLNGNTTDEIEDEYGDVDTSIASVSWSGGVSTVLLLSWDLHDGGDIDVIFELGGTPLPTIGNSAQWEAFDDSITGVKTAQGKFAPNTDIKWTDIADSTWTQDDEFYGTPGNDRFFGKQGDDYFRSSPGNDLFNGGKGFDQAAYNHDPAGVWVNLNKGKATDGWGGTDTLKSIEMARGSHFDDTLIGSNVRNHLRGLDGDDMLNGLKGRDLVRYDRDAYYGGNDGVTVNLKKGFAGDGFGSTDTLKNLEDVMGTDSKDKIIGDKGKNVLEGLGGNDLLKGLGGKDALYGDKGKDRLDGGNGDDILTGGGGADRFMFKGKNFGNDTITDFQTGGRKEEIDLDKVATIKSFKDLKNNHLSEVDGDALIEDGNGNSILLIDVAMSDLSANDFIF